MATIYIVRHGRVASAPADPWNPELSLEGRSQAIAVSEELSTRLPGKLPILTSPLRRCIETAAPLARLWGMAPVIEARAAEVPGPPTTALPRDEWLRRALVADWPELIQLGQTLQDGYDKALAGWRENVMLAVLACRSDTVIFSHFVPINVLAGRALRTERVASFRPDHTSVTIFETSGDEIRLLERGREMATPVS